MKTIALLLFILLLIVSGCTGEEVSDLNGEEMVENQEVEGQDPARDTLINALGRDFYYGPEDRTYLHGSTNVWEALVHLDDDLNASPRLAKNFYPSEDGLTWTFELRGGVQFHDGNIMDAEVVRDNLLRLSQHPGASQPWGDLVDIRVTGPLTVEIELSATLPAFPEMITYSSSAIFSPDVLDSETNQLLAPVGTGPYMFHDYTDGEITLKRFDDYWAGSANVETVVFKYVPDENTRVSALLAGEVDVLADVGVILPEQVPALQGNQDIDILTVDVLTSIFMHFQTDNPPFDNADMRRALSMLVNRDEVVDYMLDGFGTPACGFITPLASYWVNPNAAPVYNPEAAGEIIEKYADSYPEIVILVNTNWARRWPILSIAQYIQTELDKLGIKAEIKTLEMGAYYEVAKAKDYHITFTPWTGSDPDDFFRTWILSTGSFNQARGMFYNDPEIDVLIAEAASEMDREKRRELYFELQEMAAKEMPIAPIYHDMTVYAVRDYVKNFSMNFIFLPDLHSVTLE